MGRGTRSYTPGCGYRSPEMRQRPGGDRRSCRSGNWVSHHVSSGRRGSLQKLRKWWMRVHGDLLHAVPVVERLAHAPAPLDATCSRKSGNFILFLELALRWVPVRRLHVKVYRRMRTRSGHQRPLTSILQQSPAILEADVEGALGLYKCVMQIPFHPQSLSPPPQFAAPHGHMARAVRVLLVPGLQAGAEAGRFQPRAEADTLTESPRGQQPRDPRGCVPLPAPGDCTARSRGPRVRGYPGGPAGSWHGPGPPAACHEQGEPGRHRVGGVA